MTRDQWNTMLTQPIDGTTGGPDTFSEQDEADSFMAAMAGLQGR